MKFEIIYYARGEKVYVAEFIINVIGTLQNSREIFMSRDTWVNFNTDVTDALNIEGDCRWRISRAGFNFLIQIE